MLELLILFCIVCGFLTFPKAMTVFHIFDQDPPVSQGDFPGGSDGKTSVYSVGDLGSIPGLGRSPGEGNGNPLQHSCFENLMDGGV